MRRHVVKIQAQWRMVSQRRLFLRVKGMFSEFAARSRRARLARLMQEFVDELFGLAAWGEVETIARLLDRQRLLDEQKSFFDYGTLVRAGFVNDNTVNIRQRNDGMKSLVHMARVP